MTRQTRVTVVGAGSWGTTVASLVARNGSPATLWARSPEVAEEINVRHTNSAYLDDGELPPAVRATHSLEEAADVADVIVMGVPSHGFRPVLEELAPHVRPWIPIVSLTKGLEQGTNRRMTEVIEEVLPGHPAGVLAGPNLAREVLNGYAAAAVIAMPDQSVAEALQEIFRTDVFRVYTALDVIGVELAGVLKNVVAIAAGMADGLFTGDNTRALVIARGLAELTRLGVALGGKRDTFAGLAGVGDLLATCISPLSRNRTVGYKLAMGSTIDEIVAEMNMVAEGVKNARLVVQLAERHGIEMPICREMDAVVNEGRTPQEAFRGLVQIRPSTEYEAG
jgi:glycerol-3-phosphate dehydrogenase (NAD(P)+)